MTVHMYIICKIIIARLCLYATWCNGVSTVWSSWQCSFDSLVLWVSLRLLPDLYTNGTVMLTSSLPYEQVGLCFDSGLPANIVVKVSKSCHITHEQSLKSKSYLIKVQEIVALYLHCTFQHLLFSRLIETRMKDRHTQHTQTEQLSYASSNF